MVELLRLRVARAAVRRDAHAEQAVVAGSVERLWSLFGRTWSDVRARLGLKKAIDLVKAGANIRLKHKLDLMDYESQMRSWLVDPEESDDDDDDDADDDDGTVAEGARA